MSFKVFLLDILILLGGVLLVTLAAPTFAGADSGTNSCNGVGGVNGVTAYDPGEGGDNGGLLDSQGHEIYTVQDYLNCQNAGGTNCGPITVATSQTSGIQLGTVVTWPALVAKYNKTYGINLPANAQFKVSDHYAPGYGTGTFDVAQCSSQDATCFGKASSFNNLGTPTCNGQTVASTQSPSSSLLNSLSGMLGTSVTGGLGIFGGFITPVMVCNVGELYTVVGIPYSGLLMWTPGSAAPPYLYAEGTPPKPGWIIGHYVTPVPCVVGNVPIAVAPMMIGYGTGGPGVPLPSAPTGSGTPSPAPAAGNTACPQSADNLSTASGFAQAESADRTLLASEGISVNASACALGQNGVAGHCTDVSGLQCSSMTDLSQLASQCGGFELTGGSEAGHSSQHSSGNAVDLAESNSLNSCIESNYQQIKCPSSLTSSASGQCWLNSSNGSIFWNEPATNGEGQHWHVCLNGYCGT